MKKKVRFIVLGAMVISLFLAIKFKSGVKTIEEAITTADSKPINIIHEEETDGGSIVFFNNLGEDNLITAFVKKNIGGYKTVYSGFQGDIKLVASTFGVSYNYFPNIECI